MPDPDDPTAGAFHRLDDELNAFDAGRRPRGGLLGVGDGASDGYRLIGQMLGGVLGGLGLGWLADHYAGAGPWGLVGGLVIGLGLSIYATVRAVSRISDRARKMAAGTDVSGAPRERRG